MNESSILRRIQIRASQLGMRLFRMNVAQAWVGERIAAPPVYGPHAIILLNARPIRAGVRGMSDLIGWDDHGRFVAIEVKTPTGRATPEQLSFIAAVRAAGGRALIARSEYDLFEGAPDLPSSDDLPSASE